MTDTIWLLIVAAIVGFIYIAPFAYLGPWGGLVVIFLIYPLIYKIIF